MLSSTKSRSTTAYDKLTAAISESAQQCRLYTDTKKSHNVLIQCSGFQYEFSFRADPADLVEIADYLGTFEAAFFEDFQDEDAQILCVPVKQLAWHGYPTDAFTATKKRVLENDGFIITNQGTYKDVPWAKHYKVEPFVKGSDYNLEVLTHTNTKVFATVAA